MKKIPEKYNSLLSDFIKLLRESFGDNLVSAVLYGSVARCTARKDSDIDVCLVFKSLPKSRHKRTLLIFPLIKTLRGRRSYQALLDKGYLPEITPVLYTVEEIQNTKPIFLDMVEDGIILLDDGTLQRKIKEIKENMKRLGSRKVILDDGSYYWIIKPDIRLGEEVTI